jgi:hypothetical protein
MKQPGLAKRLGFLNLLPGVTGANLIARGEIMQDPITSERAARSKAESNMALQQYRSAVTAREHVDVVLDSFRPVWA